jgi:hypothetical protein
MSSSSSAQMQSKNNVVNLAAVRQAKNPPPPEPQPQPPWHIREATWILREVATLEDGFLNKRETGFVSNMATYTATPRQHAYLKAIGDRVEAATTKQHPPPPTSPDVA